MKIRDIAAVVLAVLLAVGQSGCAKTAPAGKQEAAKGKAPRQAAAPAKKTFAKGMGGLTVKLIDVKNKDKSVRIRAFKAVDGRTSELAASFVTNRMQELAPGAYDIELDTVPSRIVKGVSVSKDRETVENLGCISGSLNVKALNAKKKDAVYSVRIYYPGTKTVVATANTNRPVEVTANTYDIEVMTLPVHARNGVKIEKGKEVVIDLGTPAGTVTVKAVDEANKELQYSARIKKAENGEVVTTAMTNRPVELVAGTYHIELMSRPAQTKENVKVAAGEDANVEFTVQAPPSAAPKAAVAVPVKK